MENDHSWRHRRFPGIIDKAGINNIDSCFAVYPVRDQRSHGVNVNQITISRFYGVFSARSTPFFFSAAGSTEMGSPAQRPALSIP
jgi:hypothetical protein